MLPSVVLGTDFEAYQGTVDTTVDGDGAEGRDVLARDRALAERLGGAAQGHDAVQRLLDATRLVRSEPATTRRGPLRRRRARREEEVAQAARKLVARITTPFEGARTIAVVSTKGGVGKTTAALMLGHTLASLRDDRVVALDANPDAGSLAHRIDRRSTASATDLLDLVGSLRDYYDLRHFTTQTSSRLEVIAAPDDPHDTRGISASDMGEVLAKLTANYTLVLVDCGTGTANPATRAVLAQASQLVVVTAPRVDSAHAVDYLLSWLDSAGLGEAARQAVLVVNALPDQPLGRGRGRGRGGRRGGGGQRGAAGSASSAVDVGALVAHFAPLVRSVVEIPWDPDLARGGISDLEHLHAPTRHAIAQLAAAVADGFQPGREGPP